MEYSNFLAAKLRAFQPAGFTPRPLVAPLSPFQADLVRWASRRGRAAIFASTGLGKTRMQIEWARQVCAHTGGDVVILSPLAVASQTVAEAKTCGMDVHLCRDGDDVQPGINISNYERLHRFDPSRFVGVVLDESSCIKHHETKTLAHLLEAFGRTPYRLCATATPAPNDYTELGTHAEFLGVCSRVEMLAEFFCHDGGETQVWRLKRHARAEFWRWVASWAALVRTPSDLGYEDGAYRLPPLSTEHHVIKADQGQVFQSGQLFATEAQSLSERRTARKQSIDARCLAAAELVNATLEPWIVWCDLNAESERLVKMIPGAIEVTGSQDIDEKENRLIGFATGDARVLVSKPSICGWGLNWQHCARIAFVGVTDSWESYFQAVRRCWRFGQVRPVEVHIFASEAEGAVIKNLERKAVDAEKMAAALSAETASVVRGEVRCATRMTNVYDLRHFAFPAWLKTREE